MSSMFGENIKISIFGESHGEAIGVVLDGLPAGEEIDMCAVREQMKRRAPGNSETATSRKESDLPRILSGILNNITTGAPLAAIIENSNTRSKDYSDFRTKPRPGHADFAADIKYKGYNDISGGGHFSGRLTACMVFAGAICRQILKRKGIEIAAHIYSIGNVLDKPFNPLGVDAEVVKNLNNSAFALIDLNKKSPMHDEIMQAKKENDSIGGIIECIAMGVPAGLGSPIFGGVENRISSIMFGIPAVKGIEFGLGFESSRKRGSQNNDEFYYEDNIIRTKTNNSGGILGGISDGMPILFRVAVKPTPSISLVQKTVDLKNKIDSDLEIKGRHDPCIVPRAVPVVEAACAIALLDMSLAII